VKLVETCGTQIIRYRKGGRYVAHTDAGVDYAERYFSVVCYLNDDFTGGLTSFPSLEYSTRPQTGKAIIFPSRYFHCAEPVSSGEKFIFLTWVCGPIPITWA
jgi:predicted 2-oxoglutarate/Fe(II)-dependent dioxygenase YbiX